MDWPSFTTTDWILIVGFGALYVGLREVHGVLAEIQDEVMNIETHVSPEPDPDNWPP